MILRKEFPRRRRNVYSMLTEVIILKNFVSLKKSNLKPNQKSLVNLI